MKIVNIALYLYIRKCVPSLVADFKIFDSINPFDPVKFYDVLLDRSDYDSAKHDIMLYHRWWQGFIVFSIGRYISVDTIIGISFIHELSIELRLVPTCQFIIHKINSLFPVKYKETVLTTVDSVPNTTIVDSVCAAPNITNPVGTLGVSSVMINPLRSFSQSIASNG